MHDRLPSGASSTLTSAASHGHPSLNYSACCAGSAIMQTTTFNGLVAMSSNFCSVTARGAALPGFSVIGENGDEHTVSLKKYNLKEREA